MVIPNLKFSKMGGGYFGVNFGHLKSEVFQNGGGGGLSGLKFLKAPFWRIWTKIYCLRSTVHKPACASQIVCHILRMWRLMILETCVCYEVRAPQASKGSRLGFFFRDYKKVGKFVKFGIFEFHFQVILKYQLF